MSNEFRIAGTIHEFFSDLDGLKLNDHYLIIWQNNAKGEKVIVEGSFDSYFEEKGRTFIQARLEKNLSFLKDNPVFIYEKIQGILFKGRFEFCINNVLKIMADDKVFLKEKRSVHRFYFSYTTVNALIKTIHPDSGKELSDEVRLNDITTHGLAFRVSVSRAASILVGSSIKLEVIHGIRLPEPISGTKVKIIGVKFDKPSKLIGAVINQMKAQEEKS
jgi:hypothetical protein